MGPSLRTRGYVSTTTHRLQTGLRSTIRKLQIPYSWVREGDETHERHYYDSFDWRLAAASLRLALQDSNVCLFNGKSDQPVALQPALGLPDALYWWELQEGPVKAAAGSPLGVRAALRLVTVRSVVTTYRLVDQAKKTVGRALLSSGEAVSGHAVSGEAARKLPLRLTVQALRGYTSEIDRLSTELERVGCARDTRGDLALALEVFGRYPGDTGGASIQLDPAQSGIEAFGRVALALLEQMRKNEPGLIADIDVEFLHDYRVALRRLRSFVGQTNGVLQPDMQAALAEDLKRLGEATGAVRDLDVLLLDEGRYASMLPPALQPGLEAFFERVRHERRSARERMLETLASTDYRDTIDGWNRALTGAISAGPRGSLPLGEIAREAIVRRLGKIQKRIGSIERGAGKDAWHQLRIHGKKLRYLYESFASLFDPSVLDPLVRQLKRLQDHLGRYNDLAVQQEKLEALLQKMNAQGSEAIEMAAAIGGLTTKLDEQRRALLSEFDKAAARFDARKHVKVVERTLRGKGA